MLLCYNFIFLSPNYQTKPRKKKQKNNLFTLFSFAASEDCVHLFKLRLFSQKTDDPCVYTVY